jgi:hypothetical protein
MACSSSRRAPSAKCQVILAQALSFDLCLSNHLNPSSSKMGRGGSFNKSAALGSTRILLLHLTTPIRALWPSRRSRQISASATSAGVRRQKSIAPGFVHLESKNYREVEVLKSPGHLSGRKQVWVSAAASDTDPCQLERFCINEETSSGSLLPVVSMMQATDAWE